MPQGQCVCLSGFPSTLRHPLLADDITFWLTRRISSHWAGRIGPSVCSATDGDGAPPCLCSSLQSTGVENPFPRTASTLCSAFLPQDLGEGSLPPRMSLPWTLSCSFHTRITPSEDCSEELAEVTALMPQDQPTGREDTCSDGWPGHAGCGHWEARLRLVTSN